MLQFAAGFLTEIGIWLLTKRRRRQEGRYEHYNKNNETFHGT